MVEREPTVEASGTRRTRICLSCRRLLDSGESCPGKKHKTVSLVEGDGRKALDDEVWGPATTRLPDFGAGKSAPCGLARSIFSRIQRTSPRRSQKPSSRRTRRDETRRDEADGRARRSSR